MKVKRQWVATSGKGGFHYYYNTQRKTLNNFFSEFVRSLFLFSLTYPQVRSSVRSGRATAKFFSS